MAEQTVITSNSDEPRVTHVSGPSDPAWIRLEVAAQHFGHTAVELAALIAAGTVAVRTRFIGGFTYCSAADVRALGN